ncbi:MAG: hypothetical protein WA623_01285 [Candidatus Sulfotelmatobacter sp.]
MTRPGWITGVILVQLLYLLMLLALPVYLLVLTRTAEIRNGPHAAETISGLKIVAAVLGGPALVALAPWFGLWKGKRWGWWLTIITDLGLVGAFANSLVDDGWHNIDGTVVALTVIAMLPVVYLLVPEVRIFYWRSRIPHLPSGAVLPAAE